MTAIAHNQHPDPPLQESHKIMSVQTDIPRLKKPAAPQRQEG